MSILGRLLISVPVIALYGLVMTQVLRHLSDYQTYRWHACLALLVCGALLTPIGLVKTLFLGTGN